MKSSELFAGCGGLAYGIAEAGFKHVLVTEIDKHACSTLLFNANEGVKHFKDWPVIAADVSVLDFKKIMGIDLLSGGPPCQPFSIGGSHKGPSDHRNMWPEALRAVKESKPKAFLFENVRGLLRPAFASYLEFLQLSLSYPNKYLHGEAWTKQLKKLQLLSKTNSKPSYRVLVQAVNAADYGAAQKRHRTILWGIRADLVDKITPLQPTHSREALVWSQWVSEDYWRRHGISRPSNKNISRQDRRILTKLRISKIKPSEKPWVTIRDVIGDLPKPVSNQELVSNHLLHPGARLYAGHTGSFWDEPAKALKAGAHGVPGGENVIVNSKRKGRYFTVREMIRLQGLPDTFSISQSWMRAIRQLGNAVPVQIGNVFGKYIYSKISKNETSKSFHFRQNKVSN